MFYTQQVEMGNMNKLARLADRKTTPFYRVWWSIKKIQHVNIHVLGIWQMYFLKIHFKWVLKKTRIYFFLLISCCKPMICAHFEIKQFTMLYYFLISWYIHGNYFEGQPCSKILLAESRPSNPLRFSSLSYVG